MNDTNQKYDKQQQGQSKYYQNLGFNFDKKDKAKSIQQNSIRENMDKRIQNQNQANNFIQFLDVSNLQKNNKVE